LATNPNRSQNESGKERSDFSKGIKLGIPIALGYIPVAFTFGMMAVNGGIPVWIAILISLTNLTSAGQFAGTGLIIANASLYEITLTTLVVNIRYLLMSLALSQKITGMSRLKKCLIAFGITDETFAVASLEKEEISFAYLTGLIIGPYWGWAFGTALGALTTSILPQRLQSPMGIALYAMFIALFVPASKRSRSALVVVIMAIFLSSVFKWTPCLNQISAGWSIIIATLIAAAVGALLFPVKEEKE